MSYRPYFINVSGSITAVEGKHSTQSWVAGECWDNNVISSSGVYNENQHSIKGDLLLDYKKRAVPYAMYVASGSVGVQEGAPNSTSLVCVPGFFPAIAYFNEYITEVQAGLEAHICEEVKKLYYNGLYIGAFSVLELFLCDFLLCGVFSKEKYYQNALVELKIKDDADQYKIEKAIKTAVFSKTFHRFDQISDIYLAVFDFGFPDYQNLNKQIHRRHNIVHRYALSNQDRMTVCDASYDDVAELIRTIVCFVDHLKYECGMI